MEDMLRGSGNAAHATSGPDDTAAENAEIAATRCALMSHPTFGPMIRDFQRDTGYPETAAADACIGGYPSPPTPQRRRRRRAAACLHPSRRSALYCDDSEVMMVGRTGGCAGYGCNTSFSARRG